MSAPVTDRRSSPRHAVDARIFACLDGQTVCLDNISEQGVAIVGHGLERGSTHLLELNLNHAHVTLAVEIIDHSGDDILHARFVETCDDLQDLIHAYVYSVG
jgi:hypothetical protein